MIYLGLFNVDFKFAEGKKLRLLNDSENMAYSIKLIRSAQSIIFGVVEASLLFLFERYIF